MDEDVFNALAAIIVIIFTIAAVIYLLGFNIALKFFGTLFGIIVGYNALADMWPF